MAEPADTSVDDERLLSECVPLLRRAGARQKAALARLAAAFTFHGDHCDDALPDTVNGLVEHGALLEALLLGDGFLCLPPDEVGPLLALVSRLWQAWVSAGYDLEPPCDAGLTRLLGVAKDATVAGDVRESAALAAFHGLSCFNIITEKGTLSPTERAQRVLHVVERACVAPTSARAARHLLALLRDLVANTCDEETSASNWAGWGLARVALAECRAASGLAAASLCVLDAFFSLDRSSFVALSAVVAAGGCTTLLAIAEDRTAAPKTREDAAQLLARCIASLTDGSFDVPYVLRLVALASDTTAPVGVVTHTVDCVTSVVCDADPSHDEAMNAVGKERVLPLATRLLQAAGHDWGAAHGFCGTALAAAVCRLVYTLYDRVTFDVHTPLCDAGCFPALAAALAGPTVSRRDTHDEDVASKLSARILAEAHSEHARHLLATSPGALAGLARAFARGINSSYDDMMLGILFPGWRGRPTGAEEASARDASMVASWLLDARFAGAALLSIADAWPYAQPSKLADAVARVTADSSLCVRALSDASAPHSRCRLPAAAAMACMARRAAPRFAAPLARGAHLHSLFGSAIAFASRRPAVDFVPSHLREAPAPHAPFPSGCSPDSASCGEPWRFEATMRGVIAACAAAFCAAAAADGKPLRPKRRRDGACDACGALSSACDARPMPWRGGGGALTAAHVGVRRHDSTVFLIHTGEGGSDDSEPLYGCGLLMEAASPVLAAALSHASGASAAQPLPLRLSIDGASPSSHFRLFRLFAEHAHLGAVATPFDDADALPLWTLGHFLQAEGFKAWVLSSRLYRLMRSDTEIALAAFDAAVRRPCGALQDAAAAAVMAALGGPTSGGGNFAADEGSAEGARGASLHRKADWLRRMHESAVAMPPQSPLGGEEKRQDAGAEPWVVSLLVRLARAALLGSGVDE